MKYLKLTDGLRGGISLRMKLPLRFEVRPVAAWVTGSRPRLLCAIWRVAPLAMEQRWKRDGGYRFTAWTGKGDHLVSRLVFQQPENEPVAILLDKRNGLESLSGDWERQ